MVSDETIEEEEFEPEFDARIFRRGNSYSITVPMHLVNSRILKPGRLYKWRIAGLKVIYSMRRLCSFGTVFKDVFLSPDVFKKHLLTYSR